MADIMLTYQPAMQQFDLSFNGAKRDYVGDDGLLTAIVISLFTDARARKGDPLPDERVGVPSDLRGWWGDCLPDVPGDAPLPSIGSRLWLLWREKDLDVVVARAQQYAEEALQWLIDEEYASAVNVRAKRVESAHLGIDVKVLPVGQVGPGREFSFVFDYHNSEILSFKQGV